MRIEFKVWEYFEQLQLMEQQYGQEEDLYPWIYMLVQMAVLKSNEGKKCEEVSIRDTHNWKKRKIPKGLEETKENILKGISPKKGGAPDFLILNRNSHEYLGCVEIKLLKKDLGIKKEGECFWSGKIYEGYELGCSFDILEKESIIEKIKEQYGVYIKNGKGYFKVYSQENEKAEKKSSILNLDQNVLIKEISGTICEADNTKIISEKSFECEERNQILCHLKRFKNVLYTNGLEFYDITLKCCKMDENKYVIKVTKIANLNRSYEHYLALNNENEKQNFESEEWNKLLSGLKEYIAKISQKKVEVADA